jgi:hypothetical protein
MLASILFLDHKSLVPCKDLVLHIETGALLCALRLSFRCIRVILAVLASVLEYSSAWQELYWLVG